jgi:predicted RNA-binding protein (virulence factor B family)
LELNYDVDYEKNGIRRWYRYESIKKQVKNALGELVKDGLLKEEVENGMKKYSYNC